MVDRDILNLINSKNMNWCIRLYSTMYLRLHQYLDNFLWLVKIFNMFEFLVFMFFWKFEKLMDVEKIFARFFSLILYYRTNRYWRLNFTHCRYVGKTQRLWRFPYYFKNVSLLLKYWRGIKMKIKMSLIYLMTTI